MTSRAAVYQSDFGLTEIVGDLTKISLFCKVRKHRTRSAERKCRGCQSEKALNAFLESVFLGNGLVKRITLAD